MENISTKPHKHTDSILKNLNLSQNQEHMGNGFKAKSRKIFPYITILTIKKNWKKIKTKQKTKEEYGKEKKNTFD